MMESQNRKRAPAWTELEVRDLIAVWADKSVLSELRSKRRNAQTFEKISKGMKDRGYNRVRVLQQCRLKLKELRQAYQKAREANGCSGSEPQTCCFYDDLHAILGGAATTTPPLCFGSVNGLSHNRDAHFGDEEDSAQQASGETIFPESQELFLTLGDYNRDLQQCRVKIKELWQAYQKTKEAGIFPDTSHVVGGGVKRSSQRIGRAEWQRKRRVDDDADSNMVPAPKKVPLTDLTEVGQEHPGDDDDGYRSDCTICCHKAMSCSCVAMQYHVCQHPGHVQ
ncbi:Zinc finger and SCAN domain-containing protein 29 [Chelonia mydas]|uniref:Zinc finger and SCAN domain-containing protein 29 n=1 Tax=Chelonia mydas TaxID=8469 RepID=M7AHM6_CHEMY|nr:Zinc finger and SCAN domain-containing protein 29 [Chelonia mydas]